MIWNRLTAFLNQLHLPGFYIPSDSNSVFITFDDGPNENTKKLFQFLDDQQITSTHFWLLSKISGFQFPVSDFSQKIAIHGWNHKRYSTISRKDFQVELSNISNWLDKSPNQFSPYFRSPYGSYKSGLKKWCIQNQLNLIFWSYLFEDYLPDFHLRKVEDAVSFIKPGSILVLHDKPDYFERICSTVLILQKELSKRNLKLSCLP